ncbi:MAG: AAA family ATPase [Agrococcus casei]|uniref:AAA family ATPase n=1 Tax=Agrococcus casei TaxID=343512 RepID=UPI003F933BB8
MSETKRKLKLTRADTVKSRRQRWAWLGFIPMGTVTVCAGRGGEGKSTFALDVAAKFNHGQLDGDLSGQPHTVLVISHEDDPETVMKPRLIGAGADTTMVYFLGVEWTTDAVTYESVPKLPLDLSQIRQAIIATDARLLIIDPITSTMNGDLHKVEAVRAALDPLNALAQELDVALLAIMHFNKGVGNVSDKLSGSHAFRDVARSVLLFATDDETGKRIVTVDKSNYSDERGKSFSFELESVPVNTDDGHETTVARIANMAASELSVSDIVNRSYADDEEQAARSEASQFIIDYLKQCDGQQAPSRDVINAGKSAGFSESQMTKAKFKIRAEVQSQKGTFTPGPGGQPQASPWVWILSDDPNEDSAKIPKIPVSMSGESSESSVESSVPAIGHSDTSDTPLTGLNKKEVA